MPLGNAFGIAKAYKCFASPTVLAVSFEEGDYDDAVFFLRIAGEQAVYRYGIGECLVACIRQIFRIDIR